MNNIVSIFEQIKAEKAAKKMTNAKLAQLSGIPQGTLNKILSSDGGNIRADSLAKLCAALGISFAVPAVERHPTAAAENFGFVIVAASTVNQKVGNVAYNVERITSRLAALDKIGVNLCTFGELSLTSYTVGDLVYNTALHDAVYDGLKTLADFSRTVKMIFVVGMPLTVLGKVYNCAAVFFAGSIIGIIPKSYLTGTNEFYERRNYVPALDRVINIDLPFQKNIPFGANIIFRNTMMHNFTFAVEICHDLWVSNPPSTRHAAAGAKILLNLSASNQTAGKSGYRKNLVAMQAAKTVSAYVYASVGVGESTTDTLFSGHNIVAENGEILCETQLFDNGDAITEIDVDYLETCRQKTAELPDVAGEYTFVAFEMPVAPRKTFLRTYSPLPHLPVTDAARGEFLDEIFTIQAISLAKRVEHIHASCLVIGISGGSDSTMALLAAEKALKWLGKPTSDILAVTMPCFGTSQRTLNNSIRLANAVGATCLTIDITNAVRQHFSDIGQNESDTDTTYENAQARMRTMVLMDLANKHNGLVVGTGDMSELALGWATFNGDHMSMYGVNAGLPKTVLRLLLKRIAEGRKGALRDVINDVLDTPISPELLPTTQLTEDAVGPYVLHDFFLYHFIKSGFSPKKILFVAKMAFQGVYDEEEILKWLRFFVKRFFSQQFKRNCLPDGPKLISFSLSPRADWRMVSDVDSKAWMV